MELHQLITDLQKIYYKGFPVIVQITRNNARNKELDFCLRQRSAKFEQHETGEGASRSGSYTAVSGQIVYDAQENKVLWNYDFSEMETTARHMITDTHFHRSLHDELCITFNAKNMLKIKSEPSNPITQLTNQFFL
jgi:hypothetical protein